MSDDQLSPFEFKDELIKLASTQSDHLMLNAGRGNPNFLATRPRHAYLALGQFALYESERAYAYLDELFGGIPEAEGIVERFDQYIELHREEHKGFEFLRSALAYVDDHLGVDKDDFLVEMVDAFLGCNYPYPPRMLPISEQIIKRYLQHELFANKPVEKEFDLFATEGGTAAMTYIFQSLKSNNLIQAKDKIAMITPIFSPYLEIPKLPGYDLEIVQIQAGKDDAWQVPKTELAKLEDPAIKLFCVVNPSNPPSVKMNSETLEKIADIIKHKNPNLMIITDDVYATFSDQFESLFSKCPHNTLCVYSFSKYFGATGWRLGTIALHKQNIFDQLLATQDSKALKQQEQHYSSLTNAPQDLKFIDRLVADSRSVALNHTAGISLPQQLQMTLFALASLLDAHNIYRQDAKSLIRRRYNILLQSISSRMPTFQGKDLVGYYTLLDLKDLAIALYADEKFAHWIQTHFTGADLLKRLAEETGVVLLPGKGFAANRPCARVSLANLREYDYRMIGIAIRQVLDELYKTYQTEL